MKARNAVLAFATPLLLIACASSTSAEEKATYTEDARKAVGTLLKTMQAELKADLGSMGPAGAIGVCQTKAPKIAAGIAQEYGVSLRRVTTKNRNPKSVPDAWEADVLKKFEARLAQGDKPDSLEYSEVVKADGKQTFRYMKGLVIQPPCMLCHGPVETLSDDVKAKLAADYPNDQATGYSIGQLRGAVTLKRPL